MEAPAESGPASSRQRCEALLIWFLRYSEGDVGLRAAGWTHSGQSGEHGARTALAASNFQSGAIHVRASSHSQKPVDPYPEQQERAREDLRTVYQAWTKLEPKHQAVLDARFGDHGARKEVLGLGDLTWVAALLPLETTSACDRGETCGCCQVVAAQGHQAGAGVLDLLREACRRDGALSARLTLRARALVEDALVAMERAMGPALEDGARRRFVQSERKREGLFEALDRAMGTR